MNYAQTLLTTNTAKALEKLGLEFEQRGAYIYTKCPECQGRLAIKAYGSKKNLTYCTACKTSGHIIGLVQKLKGLEWDEAIDYLKDLTFSLQVPGKLNFEYELQYHENLAKAGISEETAKILKIGVPKGRTMMAGCMTFTVYIESNPIAYYGIQLKNNKPRFHKSFNPELLLYQPMNGKEVIFTTDMIECVKLYQEGKSSICNFGLPYITPFHCAILSNMERVVFKIPPELKREFAIECSEILETFYHF